MEVPKISLEMNLVATPESISVVALNSHSKLLCSDVLANQGETHGVLDPLPQLYNDSCDTSQVS